VVLPGVIAAGLAVAALLLAGTAAALLVAALLIAIPEHYRYRARRRSAAAAVEDRGADETRIANLATFAGSWLVPAMEPACPTGKTAHYEDDVQQARDAGTADQPT
jgi:hypothetical protein